MTEKKLTKREIINLMLGDVNISGNATYVDYLTHELELLDRKNSKSVSNDKLEENATISALLLEELAKIGKAVTITELQTTSDKIKNYVTKEGNALSNQKITYLFKGLLAENKIKKSEDKKKAYYSIA